MKFRSRLIVKLDHLKSNFLEVKRLAPKANVLFMVKADGYGHGMIPLVRYAYEELKITEYGCASVFEALKIREELEDIDCDVYVFSDIQLEHQDRINVYLDKKLIPVLSNMSEIKFLLTHPECRQLPICLKLNTGMNRLGLSLDQLEEAIVLLKSHGVKSIFHLMSHYANGSYPMDQNNRNVWQRERFLESKKLLMDHGIHIERSSMANSGAIEQLTNVEETHVRPGLMMYGPTSLMDQYQHKSQFRGKIISQLETYILRTFEVKKGTPIGYGSTPTPHDGVVALLAIGYGDGFSTRYGGAHLTLNGQRGVITGRVNMDMCQVLFPIEARGKIFAQEMFPIWGVSPNDFQEFSRQTKTIPYEIFCSLLPRVPRVYMA